MKKTLKILLLVGALLSIFVVSAMAVDYENCADDLKSLGLFKGTDAGYELERVPTRAEAAVMLVRLLGKEEAALATDEAHPFTDVPEWADKYVAYMYANGLTKGKDAKTFGTTDSCEAKMYVTFVLRALGYDDQKGDFSYDDALTFGNTVGVSDAIVTGGTFLRGNLAAVSFNALNVQPKDKAYDTLLSKLVAEKAVASEKAKVLNDRVALYKEYLKASESFNKETNIEMKMTMDMVMEMAGQKINTTSAGNIKMILKDDKLQMAMDMDTKVADQTVKTTTYYKDGIYYMESAGQKVKMTMPLDEAIAQANMINVSADPLYMIKNISKTTENGKTVYTINYAMPNFGNTMDEILSSLKLDSTEMPNISFDVLSMKAVVGSDGKMQNVSMDMTFSMDEMEIEGQKYSLKYDSKMNMEIVKTGSSVTITFPDFTGYSELSETTAPKADAAA